MVFHRILDFTRAGFLSGPFYLEHVLETIFENQLFGIVVVASKFYLNLVHMEPVNYDYNLNQLKAMYERENEVLQSRLLNGELWEQVKDQREKVTDLSIALHKKLQASKSTNPAESPASDFEGR